MLPKKLIVADTSRDVSPHNKPTSSPNELTDAVASRKISLHHKSTVTLKELVVADTSRKMSPLNKPPESPSVVRLTPLQKERYPTISKMSPPTPTVERPVSKRVSSQNTQRKQGLHMKTRDQQIRSTPPVKSATSTKQQSANDKPSDISTSVPTAMPSGLTVLANLSAGIAAAEISEYEATNIGQPRQTRTSSLRARLSAGQLIKDNPSAKSKVVGFTEFTVAGRAYDIASKDSLQVPEDTWTQSLGKSAANLYRKKSSDGLLRANRAPAQFVGGSRRPIIHRPSSRGSVRNDSRAPSPSSSSQPPKRSAPVVPKSKGIQEPKSAIESQVLRISEPRRSSIPIFRHTVSNMVSQAEIETVLNHSRPEEKARSSTSDNNFEIYVDYSAEPLPEMPNKEVIDQPAENQHEDVPDIFRVPYVLPGLEAIEESPRQNYQIKRLSLVAPEHGPILKISPSADRLIMGVESEKENPLNPISLKNINFDGSFGLPNLKPNANGAYSTMDLQQRAERPSSSQSLSQSACSKTIVSKETREKKVRSAELSYSLSTSHLRQNLVKLKAQANRMNNNNASMTEDPFFDTIFDSSLERAKTTGPIISNGVTKGQEEETPVADDSWISPITNKQHDASYSNAVVATSDSVLVTVQHPTRKGVNTLQDKSVAACFSQAAASDVSKSLSFYQKYKENAVEEQFSTPERFLHQANSSKSDGFPPRNSSRTSAPNYTNKDSAKLSPASALEPESHSAKDFVPRHNQSGASNDYASSPAHIPQAKIFKRDSTARESNKSHGSLSKGMLSNIRGMFHKRSYDTEPFSSMKSNKKGKNPISITSSESPFPPISEIHPIYRPTLSSSNRVTVRSGKANATNTDTPITPAFASPLPSEISTTTTLAMQLLDSVRTERSSPKKERALELGTMLVEAITQARDAEKAMEEAKQAARRAEIAHALCKRSVGDIAKRVLEWKDEITG